MMTDEQLIEELSFPVYRRVSTVIFAPGESPHGSSVEVVAIDPRDLQAAQVCDNAMAQPGCAPEAKPCARWVRLGIDQGLRRGTCTDHRENDRSGSASRDGRAEGH